MLPNYELTEIVQCLKWYYGGQSVQNILQLYKKNFTNINIQLTERKIKKWIIQFETNGCSNPQHYVANIDECNFDAIPNKFCNADSPEKDSQRKNDLIVKQEYSDSTCNFDDSVNLNDKCSKNSVDINPNRQHDIKNQCQGDDYIFNISDEDEINRSTEDKPDENHLPKKNTKKIMRWKTNFFCIFCKKNVHHFSRHLFRHHLNEPKIRHIFSYPTGSQERKDLLKSFRKKSNFVSGTHKPMRYSEATKGHYLPCSNCLGFYLRHTLSRHRKICLKRSGLSETAEITSKMTPLQAAAQNMAMRDLEALSQNKDHIIFRYMRADKISQAVKSDPLICELGMRYLQNRIDDRRSRTMTSNKMRELAKLLLEFRRKNDQCKQLIDVFRPENYDLLVDTTRTLSKYNKETNCYETPTFAISIGPSLKQCCQIALEDLTKYQSMSPVTEQHLKDFIELLKKKWKTDIREAAYLSYNLRKFKLLKEPVKAENDKIFEIVDKNTEIVKKLPEIVPAKIVETVDKTTEIVKNLPEIVPVKIVEIVEKNAEIVKKLPEIEPVKIVETVDEKTEIVNKLPEVVPIKLEDIKQNILLTPRKHRKRILVPWTAEQKTVVETFFQNHIKYKKPPTQDECELLKLQYSDLLQNKDWMKIKVFIQNKYTNKLK